MHRSTDGERIRYAIKTLIKNKGFQYKDAAAVLNVSVPTVKRILNSDEISLDRLIRVCQWLDVSVFELMEMSQETKLQPNSFSLEQECFLANNLLGLQIFRACIMRLSILDMRQRYQISELELYKLLREMEDLGLVVLTKDNVRLKIKWPFAWRPGGPMDKTYKQEIINSIARKAHEQTIDTSSPPAMARPFELLLSSEHRSSFLADTTKLYEEYQRLSKMDMLLLKPDELEETAGLFAIGRFCVWDEMARERLRQRGAKQGDLDRQVASPNDGSHPERSGAVASDLT